MGIGFWEVKEILLHRMRVNKCFLLENLYSYLQGMRISGVFMIVE